MEKVVNNYVKLFEHICRMSSTIEHDALSSVVDFDRLLVALRLMPYILYVPVCYEQCGIPLKIHWAIRMANANK